MAEDKEIRDILAYLEQRLPAARRAAFEARLETDAALREQVDTYRRMMGGLQRMSIQNRIDKARPKKGPVILDDTSTLYPEWLGRAVMASVTLLLIVGFALYQTRFSPARRAFDTYYRTDYGFRGASDPSCIPTLKPIIQQYEAEQYESALAALNALQDTSAACVQYQKGVILLAMGEPELSINAFDRAYSTAGPELRQIIDWYLSLAYLRNNDKTAAQQRLSQILSTPRHHFGNSAKQVLSRLNDF